MATRRKAESARSIRQSVTIPAALASEVRRVVSEHHLTMSRALVSLPERGLRAEKDAQEQLEASYRRFIEEDDPARKSQPGRNLIRSIFGKTPLLKIQFSGCNGPPGNTCSSVSRSGAFPSTICWRSRHGCANQPLWPGRIGTRIS
jgi:hypothetical protein